jgi:hypothetical protein
MPLASSSVMLGPHMSRSLRMIGAVAANLVIIGQFTQALFDPTAHINFIYGTALGIFVLEFLSLHAGGVLANLPRDPKRFLYLLTIPVYGGFSVLAGQLLNSPALPLYFMLSLTAKVLFPRKVSAEYIILNVFLLVATVMGVAVSQSLIGTVVAWPEGVLQQRPANSSGLFIDMPQTLVIWGIVYFGLDSVIKVWLAKGRHDLQFGQ